MSEENANILMGTGDIVENLDPENHLKGIQMVSTEPADDGAGLFRSASFTALLGLTKSSTQASIKRTFSDNFLNSSVQPPTKVDASMQDTEIELFRRASRKTKKRMSINGLGGLSHVTKDQSPLIPALPEEDQSKGKPRGVSGTFKNLARRSWMPSSRIESPSRKDSAPLHRGRSNSPKKPTAQSSTRNQPPEPVTWRLPSRSAPTVSHSVKDGDSRTTPDDAKIASASSKARSLQDLHIRNRSTTSIDRLSHQSSKTSLGSGVSSDGVFIDTSTAIPPVPASVSSDRLSNTSSDNFRRRDPLWNAFRTIEGEWSNFQSKTSLQKAKVIRTALLPFLTRQTDNSSDQPLRAEDLDRRVVILNKWWSGLLDLLNGRSNQSISGTDRPAFLEAILEIMSREEWQIPPFQARPGATASKWTNSIESDDSDFLLESIFQNIRNIFVQNLLSQMTFIVDKLSMRSAPASLVNFGGKTCAYAFFYCPGVADMLVRLWHIPAGILRRIFSEYGVLHSSTIRTTPAILGQSFPPPVRSLIFQSQSGFARHIHPRAQRPAGSESIRWYGPWVNRWIGRDSDLFFVFQKHYHLLVCYFHPATLSQQERLCVPGLAAVHAQLLIVLESTLYRHVGHVSPESYSAGDTADALVPLPMSIPNATRSIAENRLVILLRDMISDTDDSTMSRRNACALLIESFELLMRAATRKVSMYNSDASFVLCDLVEEVFPILVQYQHLHDRTGVPDWTFWQQVWHQMVHSETCMTQIRVIALLYSIWPILVSNEDRQKQFVLGWILNPRFFGQLFNHWSPMVRHYFYRLLCWRVARCDGAATELDVNIFRVLATRLNTAWAHHLYLVAEAEMRTICSPSSHPCSPAPGRTLIIVRTDPQPLAASHFTTFDKLLSRDHGLPYVDYPNGLGSNAETEAQVGAVKKRWNLLRTINLFGSSPSNGRPGEVTPPSSPENNIERRSGNTASNSTTPSRSGTPPYQSSFFKFSLEYINNRPQMPAKIKKVPPPLLPTNAQKVLDDLSGEGKTSTDDIVRAEVNPVKPQTHELNGARYSGRALAEWAQVRSECRNFYLRRKQEGCPKDSLIEIPAMAVETFRMFG